MPASALYHLIGSLPPTTIAALAATHLEIGETPVIVIAAPSRERKKVETAIGVGASIAAIDDGQEFSVVITESHQTRLQALIPALQVEGPFNFIRLDVVLPWTTVGYGAAIFAALAAADISVGMLSGFTTDSLLIPSAKLSAAVRALGLLFDLAREMTTRA